MSGGDTPFPFFSDSCDKLGYAVFALGVDILVAFFPDLRIGKGGLEDSACGRRREAFLSAGESRRGLRTALAVTVFVIGCSIRAA